MANTFQVSGLNRIELTEAFRCWIKNTKSFSHFELSYEGYTSAFNQHNLQLTNADSFYFEIFFVGSTRMNRCLQARSNGGFALSLNLFNIPLFYAASDFFLNAVIKRKGNVCCASNNGFIVFKWFCVKALLRVCLLIHVKY